MVVKSSRSASSLVSQGRSREEPLRVTVHYRNLAGSYGTSASCGRERDGGLHGGLLSSSGSAGRWGSASLQHNGQVLSSLISETGVRPGVRRVRFDLPADEGLHGGLHGHHREPAGQAAAAAAAAASAGGGGGSRGGWSPWSGRQAQPQPQPATPQPVAVRPQPAQQQQHRSPWASNGHGTAGSGPPSSGYSSSAGPGPPPRHSTLGHHGYAGYGHPAGQLGHHGGHPLAHGGHHQQQGQQGSAALLAAARDGDHQAILEILRKNPPPSALNHRDAQGRTPASHLAALGGGGGHSGGAGASMLELLLQCPGVDVNQADSEGNTPLHLAAQAGQLECVAALLRQPAIQIDARNAQGFTPLMKAALQGRTKCARALLLAGASPTLRDSGRGLRAEQWARFCGRHVCAELIERMARQRLLDRGTAYGRWGSEPELQAALGRVQQARTAAAATTATTTTTAPRSIKSRVRRAFRSGTAASELPAPPAPAPPAFSLVTQLTGAGLCASTPALPVPAMPPVVKSLLRPLSVPRLQVTLVGETPPPPLPPRDAAPPRGPPPPPPPAVRPAVRAK